ncbi:MAG: hypothetical protein KJO49_09830, partial [Bacteroidia bacterium]|nr:hypothetical protein [Bacteroidia bacterium]
MRELMKPYFLIGAREKFFDLKLPLLLLLLLLPFSSTVSAQSLEAFPTAYGGGSSAQGGRGGNVYHVTNLLDDGSVGSFRWAVAQPRPATIVFDVAGTINLTSTINIGGAWNQVDDTDDYLTIAGQTAPAGGITLTASDPNVKFLLKDASHVIVRYIRFRWQKANNNVGISIQGDWHKANNIIFDHCSISYSGWTGVGLRGVNTYNITFQNSIIAECKTGAIWGDSNIAQTYDTSFNGNYFYNVSHRFPNPNSEGRVDVINNVIQNPTFRICSNTHTPQLNHINNYVAAGSWTSLGYSRMNRDFDNQANHIYSKGNIIDKNIFSDPNANNESIWSKWSAGSETQFLPSSNFTNSQHELVGRDLPIKTAAEAYNDIISDPHVGASASLNADGTVSLNYDANDIAYLAKIAEGEGAFEPYTTGNSGNDRSFFFEQRYYDFLASISSSPVSSRPSSFYQSNPHIPEAWFQANVPDGQDHNDISPSGYTWLEVYLNLVDSTPAPNGGSQVNAGLDVEICEGESTVLTATGGVSYQWNTGETTASITVTPTQTTTYTVTGTDDSGNETTDDVTVFLNPLPSAGAGNDITICQGETTTLTATGGESYLWNTGQTTASINVSPNSTTTYSVTVTENNCESSDSVTVTVLDPITADAGQNVSICEGGSVTLSASGGTSYQWSNGQSSQTISVSPSVTTTYTVTVSENGCSDTDQVTVTVNPLPTANAGPDVTINYGSSATLTASGGTSYLWNTGETTPTISVSPTSDTTYSVTTSENGCEDIDYVTVFVDLNVTADAGPDATICQGETTVLTASGGENYEWSTGETTQSISVSPNVSTTYTVIATTGNVSDTDDVIVNVNPIPSANAGPDVSIINGDSTVLTATGGNNYSWSTGETTQSITVSPGQTTTYSVTVELNGCESSDDVIVTV